MKYLRRMKNRHAGSGVSSSFNAFLKGVLVTCVCLVSGYISSASAVGKEVFNGECGKLINYNPSWTVPATVAVDQSAAVGSLIGNEMTKTVTMKTGNGVSPYVPPFVLEVAAGGLNGFSTVSYKGKLVANTNISGIGLAIWFISSDADSNSVSIGTPFNGYNYISYVNTKNKIMTATYGYALIKTSTRTGTGALQSFINEAVPVFCAVVNNDIYSGYIQNTDSSYLTGGNVVNKACSVFNPVVNINMGTFPSSAFTGTGSTAGLQKSYIILNCSLASSQVTVTFNAGGSGAADAANGILNLDTPASGAMASGVGVQILYKNSPVKFGAAKNAGAATANTYVEIPFSAQYYQTGTRVTSGAANATATFMISNN